MGKGNLSLSLLAIAMKVGNTMLACVSQKIIDVNVGVIAIVFRRDAQEENCYYILLLIIRIKKLIY